MGQSGNPNLYHTWNVCLSIINTWDCEPEEMWKPSYSTLLQVFVSIQSLVMTQEVIQMEPCHEHYEIGSKANMEYSMIVEYANIKYAITGMIQNPPVEFADIVRKHFAIKKEKTLESFEKWLKKAENFEFTGCDPLIRGHNCVTADILEAYGPYSAFKEAIEECKVWLDTLQEI
ncbi:unnamed protein product [Blepharisma stoltei]|uniref:UBC core domain-containing protein n=1 Tax=Blepharisma stoltei TaxID=1481888 RepID=A0AAU9IK55_9CILI|nr:unnamed protein product [Blepharisma stoltei]